MKGRPDQSHWIFYGEGIDQLLTVELGENYSDSFIQTPGMAMSFNRYAYCLNNPFLYTYPTGYAWYDWLNPVHVWNEFWDGADKFAKWADKTDWFPSSGNFGGGYNQQKGYFAYAGYQDAQINTSNFKQIDANGIVNNSIGAMQLRLRSRVGRGFLSEADNVHGSGRIIQDASPAIVDAVMNNTVSNGGGVSLGIEDLFRYTVKNQRSKTTNTYIGDFKFSYYTSKTKGKGPINITTTNGKDVSLSLGYLLTGTATVDPNNLGYSMSFAGMNSGYSLVNGASLGASMPISLDGRKFGVGLSYKPNVTGVVLIGVMVLQPELIPVLSPLL